MWFINILDIVYDISFLNFKFSEVLVNNSYDIVLDHTVWETVVILFVKRLVLNHFPVEAIDTVHFWRVLLAYPVDQFVNVALAVQKIRLWIYKGIHI